MSSMEPGFEINIGTNSNVKFGSIEPNLIFSSGRKMYCAVLHNIPPNYKQLACFEGGLILQYNFLLKAEYPHYNRTVLYISILISLPLINYPTNDLIDPIDQLPNKWITR